MYMLFNFANEKPRYEAGGTAPLKAFCRRFGDLNARAFRGVAAAISRRGFSFSFLSSFFRRDLSDQSRVRRIAHRLVWASRGKSETQYVFSGGTVS